MDRVAGAAFGMAFAPLFEWKAVKAGQGAVLVAGDASGLGEHEVTSVRFMAGRAFLVPLGAPGVDVRVTARALDGGLQVMRGALVAGFTSRMALEATREPHLRGVTSHAKGPLFEMS